MALTNFRPTRLQIIPDREIPPSQQILAQTGSGIYVKERGRSGSSTNEAEGLMQKSLDDLLALGYTLIQARELFLSAIDWRLRALC